MLTLAELRRAVRALAPLATGSRVQGVVQPGPARLVLTLYVPVSGSGSGSGGGRRRHLLLACGAETARVSLLARAPEAPGALPGFTQYLRAHVQGARVDGVRLVDEDRQLALRLRAREGDFELLLAILGPRSNLWLLDAEGRVVAALRPPAETRPEIRVGDRWQPPASRPPAEGVDRFAEVPDDALLAAIESHYAARERADETDALRRRLGAALRKEARTRERKLAKLARELDEARDAGWLERQGELLKGSLARVERGASEIRVRDWESGEEVAIPLDPARAPSENLERIFKRYHKAVRRLARAGAQQEAVRAAGEEIAALESELEALDAGDLEGLRRFAERPPVRALLARYAPAERPAPARRAASEVRLGKRVVPARLAPRRYRSADGLEIWVGRNDAGNDHLTTRLARGNDLFFHLDGAPGSHVVLRTEGRSDPPSDSVLDACELAVHFSKLRKAGRADVHVVPIKNVKKPKGAKPGLVLVHGGRTVHLRRTPRRLERVLAARIEEDEQG